MSGTDFEKLNIILAARDREFARAMERNTRRVERFASKGQKNLSKTSKSFDLLGTAAKRLGPLMAAVGAGAVLAKVKGTISALDDIGKTADKIGLTTDALQELRTVAESAGIAQGSLDSSLERFNKRIGEAALGMGAAKKTLKQLGLEASDLADMGLDKALALVADRLNGIKDPAERAARAAALFGREGVGMLNLLREGSVGMAKMREDARALGIVIDEQLVRNAEGAQTQLDLMGRVIDAQLNTALIELAPLLVGGATAVADLARAFAAAAGFVSDFLDPQTDLEIATDNLVLAMADEIRQTQLLDTALGRGIVMSTAAAKQKLQEARARHQNALAAIAEQRALAINSKEAQNAAARVSDMIEQIGILQSRGQSTDILEGALAGQAARRQEIIQVTGELAEHAETAEKNVRRLDEAIANSKGGVVDIKGEYVAPIEPSDKKDRLTKPGKAAARAIPKLSKYAEVMDRIRQVMGDNATAAGSYAEQLAAVDQLKAQGALTAEQYADAVGAIEDKFKDTAQAAKDLENAAEQTLTSILDGSKSASEAVADLLQNLAGMAMKSATSGLFSGLFDGVASYFTPASLPARAHGGPGAAGQPYLVNENTPRSEIFVPSQNGAVLNVPQAQAALASAAGGGGGRAGPVQISINVSGARGNAEIREMVSQGVRTGLGEYDRSVLPGRVQQIGRDPRKMR